MNVEGATHKQVVDLIKSGGDVLTLTVISVTQQVGFETNEIELFKQNCLLYNCKTNIEDMKVKFNFAKYRNSSCKKKVTRFYHTFSANQNVLFMKLRFKIILCGI